MGFSDLANRMFGLYRDGEYEGALELVQDAYDKYPDEDNNLTFWEACLLARVGQAQTALEVLSKGVERGQWWPPGQLADQDLDPVRKLRGWEQVAEHCAEITANKLAARPDPIIRQGTGAGSLIAIQGARATQEEVSSTWKAATPSRWTVITPAGAEPTADGCWAWPRSIEEAASSVLGDIRDIPLDAPIVLTGFSIGSAIACHIINTELMPVDGLIAVAPSSWRSFDELRQAARRTRTLIIGGDQDPRYSKYQQLEADLAHDNQTRVDLIDGLSHANPSDLARRVSEFLLQL
jgi:predicted esterase